MGVPFMLNHSLFWLEFVPSVCIVCDVLYYIFEKLLYIFKYKNL